MVVSGLIGVLFTIFFVIQLWIGVVVCPWDVKDCIQREEKPGQFWFVMAIEGLGVIVLPVLSYFLLPGIHRI